MVYSRKLDSCEAPGGQPVKAGREFEILSRNPMDDLMMASPAISEDMIFFRTQHFMVAVGKAL